MWCKEGSIKLGGEFKGGPHYEKTGKPKAFHIKERAPKKRTKSPGTCEEPWTGGGQRNCPTEKSSENTVELTAVGDPEGIHQDSLKF